MEITQYNDYFRFRGMAPDDPRTARLPPWLIKVLPSEKNARILDIGCGFGRMLCALKNAGYTELAGIDLEDDAIAYCHTLGLDVTKASVLEYAGAGVRYDVVIMTHVLEHLPKAQTISTLRKIATALLTPTGSLIITVPNAQSNTGCYWMYEDWTHETLYTAGSLLYVLRMAGYQEIKICDPFGVEGARWQRRFIRRTLLRFYDAHMRFWNWVTSSAYHAPSPRVYSFELKAIARQSNNAGEAKGVLQAS